MTTFTGQQVDASSPQRTSAAWDESPLRTKLTLLITAAMGVGVAFGALAVTEYASWLLVAAAAGVLLFILIPFSHAWVAGPFDRLIRRMEQLARHAASADLKMLPVERRDEIGRVARAARELGHTLRRYDLEARTLRRDMNNRVEQATRAAVRKLEQLAYRDSLTGLGNRQFLDEHLEHLVNAAIASDADLLCVLIDVDNFKQVNDQLGHAAGDELLTLLGELIRTSVRPEDVACRLGGDEFVLFMQGASLQRAYQFTEQLRRLFVQQAKLRFPSDPLPGLSIGVADLNQDQCDTASQLLARADEQLYRVKRAGKNMTCGANTCPL